MFISPSYGPSGALRGRGAVEPQVHSEENAMAIGNTTSATTYIGGGAFTDLKVELERKRQPKLPMVACIQKATWYLADRGVLLERAGISIPRKVQKARHEIQCTLQADRRQRVQVAR